MRHKFDDECGIYDCCFTHVRYFFFGTGFLDGVWSQQTSQCAKALSNYPGGDRIG